MFVHVRVIAVSLVVAAAGLIASFAGLGRLATRRPDRDPHVAWALGLVGLLPAWLVAFVGLLGSAPVRRLQAAVAVAFIVSATLAVAGTIATEAIVRRDAESAPGRRAGWQWRVGAAALVPALLVALAAQVVR
jgi:uncharacterized membrane protein